MDGYTIDDLTQRPEDVLRVADELAVEFTGDEGRKYVVMSRDMYDTLRSHTRKVYRLEDIPDEMLTMIIEQIEEYCEDDSKPE